MKARIDKKELLAMASAAGKALGTNLAENGDGILNITTKANEVEFFAFNGEVAISAIVDADVYSEGSIAVNGKLFIEAIKRVADDTVILQADEKQLTIIYDDGCIKLGVLPPNRLRLDSDSTQSGFVINAVDYADTISRLQLFCAKDEVRRFLTGVNFKTSDEELIAVACDGYKLAKITNKIERIGERELDITIPITALQIISSLTDKSDEQLEINLTKQGRAVTVKQKNVTITSITYAEPYIKYGAVIPNGHKTEIELSRAELISAMDRASLVAESRNNNVDLTISGDNLKISSGGEIGSFEETLAATTRGQELEISFNVKYLTETLKCLKGDRVTLQANGERIAMVMQEENTLSLVLPICKARMNK